MWRKGSGEASHIAFGSHVKSIAHARFVLRRILRLFDEQAVAAGLMPLEHQALLQVTRSVRGEAVAAGVSMMGGHRPGEAQIPCRRAAATRTA